jgi:hypothetical protein
MNAQAESRKERKLNLSKYAVYRGVDGVCGHPVEIGKIGGIRVEKERWSE